MPLNGRRLLVAACGSIAAVKTPILVSALIQAGAEVRCIVTPSAAELVSPLALSTLSRSTCFQDEDQWNSAQCKPLHIALAEWAEIIILAPLSASTLGRWTNGIGEGLLASLLLAFEKPVIAAPAMNTAMWENTYVQSNWEKLQSNNKVLTLPPTSGLLACDRLGDGRMVDTELIELAIKSCLLNKQTEKTSLKKDWREKRLLVSAGPTIEKLDPARLISNRSSGKMGILLAQAARFRGAKVDLVHGPLQISKGLLDGLESHPVTNALEMQNKLAALQPKANVIAMAAAVSDIRRKNGENPSKINKESLIESFNGGFEPIPDLLAEMTSRRTKDQVFLGFSALTGNNKQITERGKAKRVDKGCDWLFANPIDIPSQGFEEDENSGWLLGPKNQILPFEVTSKLDLAHKLLDALIEFEANISKSNQ